MMHELTLGEYRAVLPLLRGVEPDYFSVVARAVIAGDSPGHIWADSPGAPRSAYITDKGYYCYLAGDPANEPFCAEMRQLARSRELPGWSSNHPHAFKLSYTSPAWAERMEDLFPGASFRTASRSYFTLSPGQPVHLDWRANLPLGTQVVPIDAALLSRTSLANIESVISEIASSWASVDSFLAGGFGYCLLVGDHVACWCTAEYRSGSDVGIGIETSRKYQKQGFATLTAAAFVEHCATRGLTAHWDAGTSNVPSTAVARKLGFQLRREYTIHMGRVQEA